MYYYQRVFLQVVQITIYGSATKIEKSRNISFKWTACVHDNSFIL